MGYNLHRYLFSHPPNILYPLYSYPLSYTLYEDMIACLLVLIKSVGGLPFCDLLINLMIIKSPLYV